MSDATTSPEHVPVPSGRGRRGRTGTSRRRRVVAGATGAVLAAGATAGGFGVAAAATASGTRPASALASTSVAGHRGFGGFGPGGLVGVVTAVSNGSFTLELTRDAPGASSLAGTSITVTTTSSTTYEQGGKSATSSAVVAGETVAVRATSGTVTSTTPTAASVDVVGPSLAGVVVSVNGTTVVIRDGEGFERTIHLGGSTTYTEAGQGTTVSAVVVGAEIVATGTIDANQTDLDATSVEVVLPSVQGKVTAVSGTTITITEPAFGGSAGTSLQVTTDSSTAFHVGGTTSSATISSVTVGSRILAEGTPGTSGTFAAKSVVVLGSFGSGERGTGGPGMGGGFGGFGGRHGQGGATTLS